jgi:hypothetical protein
VLLGIQLIPGGLLFLASIFAPPESPRFRAKFKPEKALKTLMWLIRQLPAAHECINGLGAMQE